MRITSRSSLTLAGVAGLAALAVACGGGSSTTGKVTPSDTAVPAGVVASASSKPADKPAEPDIATGKVGDTITLKHGNNSLTVQVGTPVAWKGDGFIKPEQADTFTVFKISITVVSGSYDANPFYFALVGADGARFNADVFGPDPMLHALSMVAGQKVTGNLSFDVPASVLAGAQIEIAGTGLDMLSTAGIWKL